MSQHVLASSFQNAILNRKENLKVPKTNQNKQVLDLLQREGFIKSYNDSYDDKFSLQVFLRLRTSNKPGAAKSKQSTLKGFKAVSKPSLQIYSPYSKLRDFPLLKSCHFGLLLLSTSEGILSHLEAEKKKIGGQILFFIF